MGSRLHPTYYEPFLGHDSNDHTFFAPPLVKVGSRVWDLLEKISRSAGHPHSRKYPLVEHGQRVAMEG